ncbi:putative ABC transport system permease protein [Haloactinopolyspora alba]|uniref:Putative ABC transport system permease protein n=1 Tax=Haloactinopolyspora alba TaxID=648780 RepID=A0A2P8DJ21_9ACTN|nr:ABC transporter permease [Haloactinopolyspora alba]PSK97227.1 putative ABC transport system permease protein [Haloactinopolyspora alba]
MITLALRSMRFRVGAFTAAFVTMVLGAAIVMACGGLMETGIRTAVPPQRLADADVVVAGDQRYQVPDSDETAVLAERVRLDADLVDVLAGVAGVAGVEGHVLDDGTPAGAFDAVGVAADDGTDVATVRAHVDEALGERAATTYVGDDRGRVEVPSAEASQEELISLAGVFGGWAVIASMFGVASMLALSVQQRRRELALLRAVGATPGQLRRMVLGEALILAVVATALAWFPGTLLGEFLFERMVDAGVVPEGVAFRQGWIPTVVAVGAAVFAAVGGALAAGRRAAGTRPVEALAQASLEGRAMGTSRALFGALFLAGGLALGIVTVTVMSGPLTSSTAGPAVFLWAVGLALLGPVLTRMLTAVLQWPVRALSGLSGHLAVLNARGRVARTAAVVAPVILLTGVATGTLYLQTTEERAARDEFVEGFVADAVVTVPDGADPGLVGRLREVPGVAAASEHVRSTAFVEEPHDPAQGEDGWTVQGVSAAGAAGTTPVSVSAGALTDLRGDTVALEDEHARGLEVGVGDSVTVRLGDNATRELRVAAVFAADEDYDTMLVPARTLARHTTDGRAEEILVAAGPGADGERMVTKLDALTGDVPGARVSDRDALFDAHAEQQHTMAFANYTLVAMIVAYAAISMVNTLVSSAGARRREFGLQRLTGATRAQVLRMLGLEGVLVAGVGVVLGTVAAAATLVPFSVARTGSAAPSGPVLIYVTVVAAAFVLTLAATLLPAWRAMRGRPAEAAAAAD